MGPVPTREGGKGGPGQRARGREEGGSGGGGRRMGDGTRRAQGGGVRRTFAYDSASRR